MRPAIALVLLPLLACGSREDPSAPPRGPRTDPPEALPILLVHGQNNHDDLVTARHLERILVGTGRFSVRRVRTPPPLAPPEAWKDFDPPFEEVRAVVLSYNGEPWPERVRGAFLAFLDDGGGSVAVHAANNGFADWSAYDDLVGLAWRPSDHGVRITVDDATGELVRTPPGEGPGAGHGRRHAYRVKVRAPDHPIMRGLPRSWMHGRDELYHGQRGPARELSVLSSAWSDPETGGTGAHEPITWWVPRGAGRSVTTVMGHQWAGQKDRDALNCVGFQTVFARAVEWAATEAVTLEVPENFPGPEAPVLSAPPPLAARSGR